MPIRVVVGGFGGGSGRGMLSMIVPITRLIRADITPSPTPDAGCVAWSGESVPEGYCEKRPPDETGALHMCRENRSWGAPVGECINSQDFTDPSYVPLRSGPVCADTRDYCSDSVVVHCADPSVPRYTFCSSGCDPSSSLCTREEGQIDVAPDVCTATYGGCVDYSTGMCTPDGSMNPRTGTYCCSKLEQESPCLRQPLNMSFGTYYYYSQASDAFNQKIISPEDGSIQEGAVLPGGYSYLDWGCGHIATAMAISHLSDTPFSYRQIADFVNTHYEDTTSRGTNLLDHKAVLDNLGYMTEILGGEDSIVTTVDGRNMLALDTTTLTEEEIRQMHEFYSAREGGERPVFLAEAIVQGTDGKQYLHFFLIIGFDENGRFVIFDPYFDSATVEYATEPVVNRVLVIGQAQKGDIRF